MQDWLLMHYETWRAFHIISVIAWMAGMLYLPRLFVYHAGAKTSGELSETLKIMERRLLRLIMNPAMISAWVFGCLMLWANPVLFEAPWMHIKLTAIVLMTTLHHVFGRWRKKFMKDENVKPAKFFRIWNEAPTVLMVIIVIMAVMQPFS